MRKYLIVKHYLKGTYTTDNLTKEDLGGLVKHDCEAIFDLQEETEFNVEQNAWIKIKKL